LTVHGDVSLVFDPSDYDAKELRSLAGLADADGETGVTLPRVEGSAYRPAAPDEPSHEQCEMLVAVGGVDPAALGERPYLRTFPDVPAGRRVGRDWIAYLVRTAGEEGTRDAIARYRARGWLGEDAAATLDARVDDAVRVLDPGDGSLDRADHLLSFAYVIRLLGIENE
jgi:archaellum component FlaD/FlaE